MRTERGLQFETERDKEALGHTIERGVAEFLDSGVFDCVVKIEKTIRNGKNDKRGIDFIVEFTHGGKLAIDVTTVSVGHVASRKLESMNRNPMVAVFEEKNEEAETVVQKTNDLIPRAIIQANAERWEEYCDEVDDLNNTMLLHMSEEAESKEKAEIIQKLLGQIEAFSKDTEYKKKTEKIKELLEEELEKVEI